MLEICFYMWKIILDRTRKHIIFYFLVIIIYCCIFGCSYFIIFLFSDSYAKCCEYFSATFFSKRNASILLSQIAISPSAWYRMTEKELRKRDHTKDSHFLYLCFKIKQVQLTLIIFLPFDTPLKLKHIDHTFQACYLYNYLWNHLTAW